MPTLQVRVDAKTKQSANKVLADLGIDMSSAVKVYLKQIALRRGIPFPLLTGNSLTPQGELGLLKASREARAGKKVTSAMSPREAIAYLESL